MKTGYKISDAMTIHPVKISKKLSLKECALLMKDNHVGSLIIEEDGKVTGILTEQDLVRKAMAKELAPSKTTAEDIMETEIVSIKPDKDIYDALKIMRDYNIRHLPVVDQDKLVGFLTIKDILKIEPQLFELIVEKFELREETRKPVFGGEDDAGLCEECHNFSSELKEQEGQMLCPDCRQA